MIYLVDLEYIPTRYTSQWKTWIPEEIQRVGLDVTVIDGTDGTDGIGKESFFNFNTTARYKAEQTYKLSELFINDEVSSEDIFLFTDAWHPGVIQLRQMITFSEHKPKVYGMWHAGSYDPADLLGQKARTEFIDFERSLCMSLDKSFFATEFHLQMFKDTLQVPDYKLECTGFPYDFKTLYDYDTNEKEDVILFPHRLSIEKHPELFDELSKRLPNYKFIKTLDVCNNMDDFYKLLSTSKYSISFSEQETWGIACFESLFLNCLPIVPNQLSYREMYTDDIKYEVNTHELDLVLLVINKIKYLDSLSKQQLSFINKENVSRLDKFCTFENILNHLKGE